MMKHALHHSAVALISALALTGCPETNDPESEAGATAGTAAGATAGTAAGTAAGTTAGTVAGTMTMPPMGGAMTMPPMGGAMTMPPMGGAMTMPPMGGAMVMPPVGGDMPEGGDSCADILNCLNAQMCADQACFDACVSEGSPAAQATFASLFSCLQRASMTCGQQDQACLAMACQSEGLACQGDGPVMPPMMDLSCAETLFCASQCAPNNTACQQGCINAVSATDAPILNAYAQCLQTNMCQDEACVQMNCSAQYEACLPPGMSGCNDVLMCLSTCRDEQCAFDCQRQADAEAQGILRDLVTCVQTNNCMSDPTCPACSTQFGACQAD